MFKRVKTLMVTGALVLGMAMPAFAADPVLPTADSLAANIKILVGTRTGNVHVINESDMIPKTEIEEIPGQIGTAKGLLVVEQTPETGYEYQWVVHYDGDLDGKSDNDKWDVQNVLIIKAKSNDEKVKDKGKLEIDLTPSTGDALALGGLAVSAVAAGGLVVVNRKKRNK